MTLECRSLCFCTAVAETTALQMQCLVAVDLKAGKFLPEYVGKMQSKLFFSFRKRKEKFDQKKRKIPF
jgi:hypothetical protein